MSHPLIRSGAQQLIPVEPLPLAGGQIGAKLLDFALQTFLLDCQVQS